MMGFMSIWHWMALILFVLVLVQPRTGPIDQAKLDEAPKAITWRAGGIIVALLCLPLLLDLLPDRLQEHAEAISHIYYGCAISIGSIYLIIRRPVMPREWIELDEEAELRPIVYVPTLLVLLMFTGLYIWDGAHFLMFGTWEVSGAHKAR